jgi:putative hydrolase of the HAD superfamily
MTITTLFVDIGGVLLSKGWGKPARELAAKTFQLDFDAMEKRHQEIFATYELGKIQIEYYLQHVVFNQERNFSSIQFQEFMFSQSQSYPQMLELIRELKQKYRLKVVAVSNEALELNMHRIKTFRLNELIDFFISSCFVHLRKPDPEIFQLALNVSQVDNNQVAYIEDTPMFVNIAANLGIHSIQHMDYQQTSKQLAQLGLSRA